MLAHRLAERAEDDAELRQLALERRRHRDAVEHRVYRDPGQHLAFPERNAKLLIGAQQLGIDLVERFRPAVLLWRRIIGGGLVIDRRQVELGPIGLRHLLPGAKRGKAPFEEPFGLVLLGRDEADRLLAEAGRRFVGFDVGDKTVFVALLRKRADGVEGLGCSIHAGIWARLVAVAAPGKGRRTKLEGVTIASSVTVDSAWSTARLIAAQCGRVGQ